MIDLVFFLLFLVMATRIATTVWRESPIFKEFEQSRSLAFVVWLFPASPLVLLFGGLSAFPALAWPAAVVCFIPALIISRKRISAFEQAGTDRVSRALSASSSAFGTAIIGLSYIAFITILNLAWSSYGFGA